MKSRYRTLWTLLMAMFIVTTLAVSKQQTYPFAIPEVIDTQLDESNEVVNNYAISLPSLKLPLSFYTCDTFKYEFIVCLKSLRIKATTLTNPFPTDIICHVISINGP